MKTEVSIELEEIKAVLKKHFSLLYEIENLTIDWASKKAILHGVKKSEIPILQPESLKTWSTPIVNLFSTRARNCFRSADIDTCGDLILFPKRYLLKFRNLGKKTRTEIENKILDFGFSMEDWGKAQETGEIFWESTYKDIFSTFDFYSELKDDVVSSLEDSKWEIIESRKAGWDLPTYNTGLSNLFRGQEQNEEQWKIIYEKYNDKIKEARYLLAIHAMGKKV